MRLVTKLLAIALIFLTFALPAFARLEPGVAGEGGGGIFADPRVQNWIETCNQNQINATNFVAGCSTNQKATPSFIERLLMGIPTSLGIRLKPDDQSIVLSPHSPLATLGNAIDYMAFQQPPASSVYYVADLSKNLGIDLIPSTYAAAKGVGFTAFYPILGVWRAFTNIAYGLLAIVFVVIGFLIMFRSRIGAQTEVTVQAALPRLVVTMILIAFSYPIAGLLIDLMYVVIYAFVGFLAANNLLDQTKTLGLIFSSNPFSILFGKGFSSSAFQISQGAGQTISGLMGTDLLKIITGLSYVGSVILWVLLLFFLVVVAIRIFITLVKAYAQILFYVALAPVYIITNAFPGSNAFSSWFKNLAAKLLTFPIVIFHIVFAAILVQAAPWGANNSQIGFGVSGANLQGWSPPLFNFGIQQGSLGALLAIVALGVLWMAPTAAETADNLIKGQLAIDFGAALGGAYQQTISPIHKIQDWKERRKREKLVALGEKLESIERK